MNKAFTILTLTLMFVAVSVATDAAPPPKAKIPEREHARQQEWDPPGLAYQLRPCPTDEQRALITGGLKRAFRNPANNADPDVRSVCSDPGNFMTQTEKIGVWLNPITPATPQDLIRENELAKINILRAEELFAWSILHGFLATIRDRSWAIQPRRLNNSGKPDPNGKIHLTFLGFTLTPPDRVRTEVKGFYDAGPNVDFLLRVDSKISVVRNKLVAEGDPKLDLKTETFRWLFHLVTVLLPPLGLDWEDWLDRKERAARYPDSFSSNNFGALLANSAPNQFMIKDGRKLNFIHKRFEIRNLGSTMGVTGGGTWADVKRQPAVAIVGPRNPIVGGASASFSFGVKPTDLRATANNPLQIRWSADGRVVNPTSASTEIFFSGFAAGRENPRNVTVRITDADSLTAQTNLTVRIQHERGGLPPVCREKPWLPECRPDQPPRR